MPSKDIKIRRKTWNKWYSRNKPKFIKYKNKLRTKRVKHYKEKLLNLMGNRCICCGYNDNLSILEFHHCEKSDEYVSNLTNSGYGWGRIWKEARKCVLMCPNCHAKIHKLK